MEIRAIAKFVRVQPRKVRIVADEITQKSAVHAATLLRFHPSKGSQVLRKVILSAVANAVENNGAGAETLRIAKIQVDEGPRLKRIQPRSMGRAYRILKRTSHVAVYLEDDMLERNQRKENPNSTKPKPRPTFSKPSKDVKKISSSKDETKVSVENLPVEEPETEVTE